MTASSFEQVVDYLAAFDPLFAESIKGAAPDQIDQLEELLDSDLPDDYREFLELMGRNLSWAAPEGLDLSIEAVLSYYQRENWLPADRYIRIGDSLQDPSCHPHLEIWFFSDDPPNVVAIPDCNEASFDTVVSRQRVPLAGSLAEMICLPAFRSYELCLNQRQPTSFRTRDPREEAIQELEEILLVSGFEKQWFSTKTGRAYRRNDAAVQAIQHGGHPLRITLSADNATEQEELAWKCVKRLEIDPATLDR